MTRLVIEDMDGNLALPLCAAFENWIVIKRGYEGRNVDTYWVRKRCALVSREAMATSAYIDPIQVAERALGGPLVQWHRRDEP